MRKFNTVVEFRSSIFEPPGRSSTGTTLSNIVAR